MDNDDRPQGLKGWLVLPGIGLVLTPLLLGYQLYEGFSLLFDSDFRQMAADPTSPIYSTTWMPLIVVEAVLSLSLLVGTLFVLRWFFTKSPRLPGAYIAWSLAVIAIQVIDVVMFKQMNMPATVMSDAELYKDLGRSIVQSLIWIPYFLTSERVKNTFVAAAPPAATPESPDLPTLAQPPAAEP